MTIILFVSLLILILLNIPIALSIALASVAAILFNGNIPLVVVVQKMIIAADSFPLMAVPFFILAGSIMEHGGISSRLIRCANVIAGQFTGGLALVAIIASLFFGAISGSAAATVAAIGGILIPAMIKRGYDVDYATAVQASAGTLGVMIPPSIPMVVYGVLTGASIGTLFIAGIMPGILVGFSLMLVAYVIAKRRGYTGEAKASKAEIIKAYKDAIFALLMPVIILGGIYGSVFTPTEAAVVAVVYGIIIGIFVYKELKPNRLKEVLASTAVTTGTVMFIICTAAIFGWVLASEQIPQVVAASILSISENPIVILALINLLLLIIGTFMETTAAIIIVVPVLMPIIDQLGINPIHFGIIVVVNLAMGMITPPLGVCLFVGCGISKIKLEDITRAIWPFVLVMIIDIIILTYIPIISLFLPKLMGMPL
ncbi:MAG: TRAP transporter large permease [Peptostreptococcales bacterium]